MAKSTTPRKIFKYPFAKPVDGINLIVIQMPVGAEPIDVGQDPKTGGVAMWAVVDPDKQDIDHEFLFLRTGDDVPSDVGPHIFSKQGYHIFQKTF